MKGGIKLILTVPFYRRPDLAERLIKNLSEIMLELQSLQISLVFVNDSPDDSVLAKTLREAKATLNGVDLTLLENSTNLGFLKSVNQVFELAVRAKRDVIVLNSDCAIAPGSLTELVSVSRLDEKIAFCCPRSNNATIASLPHEAQFEELSFDEAYRRFRATASQLPRFTYAPTAVGFCLLVKWEILTEFGYFDEIYGGGYQEENDLVMRANRAGYRAALANHAFVWHEGSQSFNETSKSPSTRDAENVKVINKRYPEFGPLVNRFHWSVERKAEAQISAVLDSSKPLILFDFSHIGTYYNGTFEAALKIAEFCVSLWSWKYEFGAAMDVPAWHFHGLDKWENIKKFNVGDRAHVAAAIVRVGQPFDMATLERLYDRAAVNAIYMLDTIAMDCGSSDVNFESVVWDATMEFSDVIFSISKFTETQLLNRFTLGDKTTLENAYLSLDPLDYLQHEKSVAAKSDASYNFIVGNSFAHKFVNETADFLASAIDEDFWALGYKGQPKHPNLRAVKSGALSDSEMESLWANAKTVIFPSHYEGFGFPLLHALARKKVVYARDCSLNRELQALLPNGNNVFLYSTTRELEQRLKQENPTWNENVGTAPQNWMTAANQLIAALESKFSELDYEHLRQRMAFVRTMSANKPLDTRGTPAALVGRFVEQQIEQALRLPGVKRALTPIYNLIIRK